MVALGVTVFIPRSTANKAFSAIKAHRLYDDVSKIVRKNCYDTYYMVGGMVYRNLAIAYHNSYNARVIDAADNADFDFLVLGKPKTFYVPEGWRVKRRSYSLKNSVSFVYKDFSGITLCKVDIISIKDIPGANNSVADYFNFVPLDIQAIAAQPEYGKCFGPGISAITSKKIRVKNPNGFITSITPNTYAKNKANSMGFEFVRKVAQRYKRPCTCDSRDLLWHGCRCGGK